MQVQPPHTAPEMCQRYTPQKDPTLRWQGRRCGDKPHSNRGVYHISIGIVAPWKRKVNYRKGHSHLPFGLSWDIKNFPPSK